MINTLIAKQIYELLMLVFLSFCLHFWKMLVSLKMTNIHYDMRYDMHYDVQYDVHYDIHYAMY
jgi:hypothetical protein